MECPPVYVHIVTFNSGAVIHPCIDALSAQSGYSLGSNLRIRITDNGSEPSFLNELRTLSHTHQRIEIEERATNLGFCGGHNLGAAKFLATEWPYLLVLNPDLALAPDALSTLTATLESNSEYSAACPLLLRADKSLKPFNPPHVDCLGMEVTSDLRHFDRGADVPPSMQVDPHEVFGGSGAALLMSRRFVMEAKLAGANFERETERLYPQLCEERERRFPLFDEAFFAYREDADLAWRAQLLGLRTIAVPRAVGYHVRRVTPERRKQIPAEVNRWSVRNRFLLQGNNLFWPLSWQVLFKGVVLRNLVVIAGVFVFERSSIGAFRDLWILRRRSRERRALLRACTTPALVRAAWRWFHRGSRTYTTAPTALPRS